MGEIGIESTICSRVAELECYEPPDWEALAARASLSPDQVVRLDAVRTSHRQKEYCT